MNALEQFFVDHPELMTYEIPHPQRIFYSIFFIMCLFLGLKLKFEDKEKQYAPIPDWAGKCWRYSWLFAAIALAGSIYGSWNVPKGYGPESPLEIFGMCGWAVLFIVGNFGILKAAFRHAIEANRKSKLDEELGR